MAGAWRPERSRLLLLLGLAASQLACGSADPEASPPGSGEPTEAAADTWHPLPADEAALGSRSGCASRGAKSASVAQHPEEASSPRFVYAANQNSHDISTYAVEPSGALVPRGPSVAVGRYPQSLALHPSGRSLFVANRGSSSLSVLRVDPNSGSPRALAPDSFDCGVGPLAVVAHPSGDWVFVGSDDQAFAAPNTVTTYAFDRTTETLRRVAVAATGSAGLSAMVADPSGRFLYVTNAIGDTLIAYELDECDGSLQKLAELETAPFPIALTVSASGDVLYVAAGGAEPAVQAFFIDPSTGKLRPGDKTSGGFAPWSLRAMRLAAGPFLLLVSLDERGTASLSSLALDAETGRPAATPTSTVTAGVNATDLAVGPAGRSAYVGNFGSNDISAFALDPSTGVVTPLGSVPAGTAPGALAVASTR